MELLLSLQQERRSAILLVTHDEKVARHAHRQLCMKDGQLVSPEEMEP
jgi:predicted ABC-type transport system involved in lysophospholipase L1 biosynthesis ATPase subunit